MRSRVSPPAAPSAPLLYLARVFVAVLLAAALPAAPARAQDAVVDTDGLPLSDAPAAASAGPQGTATPALVCSAQQSPDETCVVVPETQGSLQRAHINLRLVGAGDSFKDVRLRYRTSSGTIVGDEVLGDTGAVRLVWYRPVQPDSVGVKARITVEALTRNGPVVQYVEVRPPTRELVTRVTQTFSPVASPGATLSRPMIIEIREVVDGDTLAITDPEICRRQRIAFRGQGAVGTFTPDTASGVVYNAVPPGKLPPVTGTDASERSDRRAKNYQPGCFAAAGWKVGDAPGRQRVRPLLVPGPGHHAAPDTGLDRGVVVRRLPRFIVGPVFRFSRDYRGREAGDGRVIRVERELPTGETIAYDSIPRPDAPKVVGGPSITSMAGISVPFPVSLSGNNWRTYVADRLTMTVAANPTDPRRDQYYGLSVLPFGKNIPETYPIEIHVLVHSGFIDELVDRQACRDQVTLNSCQTRRRYAFRGGALSVSIDAGSVIADVIKKLAP